MSEENNSDIISLDDNSNQSNPTTKERILLEYDYREKKFRMMTKIFPKNI